MLSKNREGLTSRALTVRFFLFPFPRKKTEASRLACFLCSPFPREVKLVEETPRAPVVTSSVWSSA